MVHQLSSIVLPDGATLAYEVLGVRHLGRAQPIVLVGGMTSRRVDWDRLAESLEKEMPGESKKNILWKGVWSIRAEEVKMQYWYSIIGK